MLRLRYPSETAELSKTLMAPKHTKGGLQNEEAYFDVIDGNDDGAGNEFGLSVNRTAETQTYI